MILQSRKKGSETEHRRRRERGRGESEGERMRERERGKRHTESGWSGAPCAMWRFLHCSPIQDRTTAGGAQFYLLCCQPKSITHYIQHYVQPYEATLHATLQTTVLRK